MKQHRYYTPSFERFIMKMVFLYIVISYINNEINIIQWRTFWIVSFVVLNIFMAIDHILSETELVKKYNESESERRLRDNIKREYDTEKKIKRNRINREIERSRKYRYKIPKNNKVNRKH